MTQKKSFFVWDPESAGADLATGARILPTQQAHGLWGPDTLKGPAICALAAYVAETEHGAPDWQPSRLTIELFKSAKGLPTSTRSRVLRDGRRIKVVEVQISQHRAENSEVVAQAVVVFLRPSENPPGERWQHSRTMTIDPPRVGTDDHHFWFNDDEHGWGSGVADYQHGDRVQLWTEPIPALAGITPTPFQIAVTGAESTSLVTNWGTGGIGFINCDLTVALTRLPVGRRVGVQAQTHLEANGISTGTATLYDAVGEIGTGMVVAISNTHAMIDFAAVAEARGIPVID